MELKLQQAIVATRAGQIDVAQSLLTQLIREKPEEANAWFLLSYLIDQPDRQIRYLQRSVELDSENELAKQHLVHLQNSLIPPPVISQSANNESSATETNQLEEASLTATLALEEASGNEQAQVDAPDQLPEWLQDLDQKQLGSASAESTEWPNRAGPPKRESSKTGEETQIHQVSQVEVTQGKSEGEIWLVRILVLMVIIAAIVLGLLVILILIQP